MEISTSDIIAIVALFISVLVGGGVLSSYLQERKRYKEFLLRLQSILNLNKKIHKQLTQEIDLKALEYAPDNIQEKFNKLDDNNPVKRKWNSRIETIIDNNDRVINLIWSNIGFMKSKDLKEKCEKFIFHAQEFNDIWKRIRSGSKLEPGRDPNTDLLGRKYPKGLDRLLQREIDKH